MMLSPLVARAVAGIFYVESCVYLMTLYDLLSSGHRVWQVYDCFYSTGDEDQGLFEYMVSNGVKLNFEEFLKVYWNDFEISI